MRHLEIKTHNFEKAKNRLKEFSQKEAEELKLDSVKINGGFLGLGDHKVTGYELNSRLSAIQKHLVDLNDSNNKTIKEFGQVYSALESLDKDYIKAIITSIKATEKTSESIQATQEQIKKIVYDQKKTLEVLKKFKQKLDNYSHLEDIDKIWSECQKWNEEISKLSNSIIKATLISNTNTKKIDNLEGELKVEKENSINLSNQLNQQNEKLEDIIVFKDKLKKIAHLEEIDDIWDSNEVHSNRLFKLEENSQEMNKLIHTNKELIDNTIESIYKKNDAIINLLTKKIKYAYILASGALGVALIELMLLLFKVI